MIFVIIILILVILSTLLPDPMILSNFESWRDDKSKQIKQLQEWYFEVFPKDRIKASKIYKIYRKQLDEALEFESQHCGKYGNIYVCPTLAIFEILEMAFVKVMK